MQCELAEVVAYYDMQEQTQEHPFPFNVGNLLGDLVYVHPKMWAAKEAAGLVLNIADESKHAWSDLWMIYRTIKRLQIFLTLKQLFRLEALAESEDDPVPVPMF